MPPYRSLEQVPGALRADGATPPVVAAALATQRQEEPPLTEAERRALEQALARLGFYPGPLDGVIDGESEQAIRSYQVFAALPADGKPGRRLLVELKQVAQLADDRYQASAELAGEASPVGPDETAPSITPDRSITADRTNLAATSPVEPQSLRQPAPVVPLRKPDPANPSEGNAIEQAAAGKDAEPLPTPKPSRLAEEAESGTATGTPVAFAVGSLPLQARRAIQTGQVDVRLATGHTPLIAAVLEGQRDAVAALLQHGADPNLASADRATALMYAAWAGDADSVRLLLEAGAEPNRRNLDGKTALMAAAATGHPDIVALLLESGAAPDLQALKGWTALMYAVWRNQPEVVRLLLKHRANILIANSRGETALDLAAERARAGIHALLVNASGSS